MPEPNRVVIDRVDWKSVLPVLRLASALKHALQPGKLLVALVAVVLLHGCGLLLDMVWPSENSADKRGDYSRLVTTRDGGPYQTFLNQQTRAFSQLTFAALSLDHGLDSDSGVTDQLSQIVVYQPLMLFDDQPLFASIMGVIALFVLAISAGILCRMCATQVCANCLTPTGKAIAHVRSRWIWYVLTPLMPLLLCGVLALLLFLAGLLFFNAPWLDVIGALEFGVLLLLGVLIAVVLLLFALSLLLMPPALSVEGSDGFDAISRSFNYTLFRPWQFALYLFATMLYLGVVYVLLASVVGVGVGATQYFVSAGSFSETGFDQIISLSHGGEDDADGANTQAAAWIVGRWMDLLSLIVVAILFSTLCCLQTQVYVLMRRSADGTPMDQCDGDEEADLWAEAPASEQADSTDDTAKAQE